MDTRVLFLCRFYELVPEDILLMGGVGQKLDEKLELSNDACSMHGCFSIARH